MKPEIYSVIYVDGNWKSYDPLGTPTYSYSPPDLPRIEENLYKAIEMMGEVAGGKFVIGVHSGVYCRESLFREPFMSIWRHLVQRGGELALHPHEEIIAKGSLFQESMHMEVVINSSYVALKREGLQPTAFRGGYNAFSQVITPLLEEHGIMVDLSALPGVECPKWDASWSNAETSAYYLCAEDFRHGHCGHRKSGVLEIPMGWDGQGADLGDNYLYNEKSSLQNLQRVWGIIEERARQTSKPQFVHFLCHLHAMGDRELVSRCAAFLSHIQDQGGVVVTPSEAKELFDNLGS